MCTTCVTTASSSVTPLVGTWLLAGIATAIHRARARAVARRVGA